MMEYEYEYSNLCLSNVFISPSSILASNINNKLMLGQDCDTQ